MTISTALDPDSLAPDAAHPLVRDVMRDEVVFCLPSTPLDAVAKLLADNDLTELPVFIDRRPVGYVTAEDVLARFVAGEIATSGSDFAMRPVATSVVVRDVLRTPPLVVDENQPFHDVVALMGGQAHDVALVLHEDETPVGMLSLREIADFALRSAPAAETANA